MKQMLLIMAAALCGLAWGHDGFTWMLVSAALVPLLWHQARTRWIAGLVALAFYLAASRGLPFGVGIFFAETAPVYFGWALWLAAGAVNAALWFVLWSKTERRRLWALPAIELLPNKQINFE